MQKEVLRLYGRHSTVQVFNIESVIAPIEDESE